MCTIDAVIPIAESFGFIKEIREKCSGNPNPMLEFYDWKFINIDPFYIPITKKDIEMNGLNIDTPNLAKKIINKVRIKKGLSTDDKIVVDANKQKNLGKNK